MSLGVARLRRLVAWFVPTGADGLAIRRNVGWLVAERAFRLVVGLAINVWLVRYLGADRLGLLGFTHSLVVLFSVVSVLGIESILVRELGRRPREAGELLGTALGLRLGGAVLTLAFSIGAIALLRPDDRTALALALILGSVTFAQAFDIIEQWFQSRTAFGPYVIARSIGFVGGSLAKIACLLASATLEWIALAMAVEFLVAAVALLVVYRGARAERQPWHFRLPLAARLMRETWPLMINGLAIVVYTRTDQVMLALLRGDHENGVYAAAQRLSEVLYFVPVAAVAAATPALHRSFLASPPEYRRRLTRLFGALAWTAVIAAASVSLLSSAVTAALFGETFRASGPVLALHVWAAPAMFLGVAQSHWFIAHGRQRDLMMRTLIGAAMNVALNAALIPRFGASGAAAASLMSQAVASVFLNALFPSTRELFRMQMRALLAVPMR